MKEFTVRIPVAGYIDFTVKADTKEEAIDKAWDSDADEGDFTWEMYEKIVQGNVFYGECNSVSIESEEEIED